MQMVPILVVNSNWLWQICSYTSFKFRAW